MSSAAVRSMDAGLWELMESIGPVVRIDARGCIVRVNRACVALFGLRAARQLEGENVAMLMPETHAARHDAYIAAYLASGEARAIGKKRRLFARRIDGSQFPIELHLEEVSGSNGEREFIAYLKDLTELREQEGLASHSQAITAGVFDSAVDALIVISTTGVIERVNVAASRLFGFSQDEMTGQNVYMLMPEPTRSQHDQYLRNYLQTGIARVIGKQRELEALKKDGTRFPIHLSLSEVKKEGIHVFCGAVRDLTSVMELRAERKSGQLKDQIMASIFEASVDPLVVINSTGIIQRVNPAALAVFGYENLVGRNVSILCPPPHNVRHDAYLRTYLETGIKHVMGTDRDLDAIKSDGTVFPVCLSLTEVVVGEGEERLFAAFIRDQTLRKQQEQSEQLILNMLPKSIAEQLVRMSREDDISTQHIAHSVDEASIFFADVVGFTSMSEKLPALTVVRYLNDIFSRFDKLVEYYQIEKVKTIGDCYMCVAGIPEARPDHAEVIVRFALDVMDALAEFNASQGPEEPRFGLRVGINSGTLVAGVLGTRKFLYDVWGSAANLASRMESTALNNTIQISSHTFKRVAAVPDFRLICRGEVFCKGIGMQTTYLVERSTEPQKHFPKTWWQSHQATIAAGSFATVGVLFALSAWWRRRR